ncbi:MAG: AmmeMemoRadiSam system protein A [Nanoarchaeota archaeon]|nr:AmmeMemoRadiSam system protein A [Nanoarchaeota archaeon]
MLDKNKSSLLEIARKSIMLAFDKKGFDSLKSENNELNEKKGAFVTLYYGKGKSRKLRGCVGFIFSKLPLWQAVAECARLAAFQDERFIPLKKDEMNNLLIEISVLTTPKQIKAKLRTDIVNEIEVGEDGLIVEHFGSSGLLLPQVAAEYGWDAEEFLGQTCIKAGLPRLHWKDKGCRISKFQCEIFSEK